MQILMLHNSYRIRGGEDESFQTEVRMLRASGHYVETVELSNDKAEHINKTKLAMDAIWSRESFRIVDTELSRRSYDVVHVQNFFPLLSPSTYYAARKHSVAVVQTLRNYRLLCPSGIFFRDGHICEDCLKTTHKLPGIANACYRQSRLATAAVASVTALHTIYGTWESSVDLYIALTEFSRSKFIEAGFDGNRIFIKGNCVYPDPCVGKGDAGFMLFVGRLTPEKGILTLLQAWSLLDRPGRLKIVGEGPLEPEVRRFCADNSSIEWVGPQSPSATLSLMGQASTLIFPSEWYETFGRVVIESFAKGTPVIASNLGSMTEIMRGPCADWLFTPGDPISLAMKIQWCLDNPGVVKMYRKVARQQYEATFTAEANCQSLIFAYNTARQNWTNRGSHRTVTPIEIGQPT